ncbi:MAG: protein kinase [Gemmataceae bacterium]|jgi:serine/threonine protein kinase/Flp pilus assembly protein TadD|nr:protein kinase [Gemmataceae bacterium]
MSSNSSASISFPIGKDTENLRRPKPPIDNHNVPDDENHHEEIPQTIGRYQIQGELGRGGMGIILRGHDLQLNREAAIKLLPCSLNQNPYLRERFLEEAAFAAQLQHPNIIPVYDTGTLPDGRPYFVMQAVRGITLAKALSEPNPSPTRLPHYLNIFRQVCQAVVYAHSRRILHRDLKPSNVMLGDFGEVFVVDWGLARKLKELPAGEPLSHLGWGDETFDVNQHQKTSHLIGTPAYMAPEQAHGLSQAVDTRSDVFGLGGILCEILTGQPPYVGKDTKEIQHLAEKGDQTALKQRLEQADIDPELREIVQKCLNPNPDERYNDASEVLQKIDTYLDSLEQRARRAELARVEAAALARAANKRRKLVYGIIVSLGFVFLLASIGAYREYHWDIEKERRKTALQLKITPVLSIAENDLKNGNYCKVIQTIQDSSLLLEETKQERLNTFAEELLEDALFLGFLEQVRQPELELDPSFNLDPNFIPLIEMAFEIYQVHPLKTSRLVFLEKFQKSRIRLQIVETLDLWAWIAQRQQPDVASRLHEIAYELEPEAYLPVALREISVRNEPARLLELLHDIRLKDCTSTHITQLASLLIRHGMMTEAEQLASENLRLRPESYWAHSLLGSILVRKIKDPADQAVRHLKLGRALRPKWSLNASQTQSALPKFISQERAEQFKRLLLSSPQSSNPLAIEVLLKARAGKYREAESLLVQLTPSEPNAAFELLRARVFALGGDELTALKALRTAHCLDPQNLEIVLFLCDLLIDREPEDAEKIYERVFAQNPKCLDAYIGHAQLAVRTGPSGVYQQRLAQAVAMAPNNPEIYLRLAHTLSLYGDPIKALELFNRGCEIGANFEGWNPPSEAVAARYQRLVNTYRQYLLYKEGTLVLETRGMPVTYTNPEMALTLAVVMARQVGNEPLQAAEIFRIVFRDNPKIIHETSSRIGYPVAAVAAIAATGSTDDPTRAVTPKERDDWSHLAAVWLSNEIDRLYDMAKIVSEPVRRYARIIQNHPRLSRFHESDFLGQLPKPTQELWAQNWQRLDDLIK